MIGETERTGTTVNFLPDVKSEGNPEGIFETGDFQYDTLKVRLREMAFLNKGIKIVLRDERVDPVHEHVFHYEGGVDVYKRQEYRNRYGCNIPWAILLDPTSACNLHCTGCWAAEYGNRLNLTLEEIDDIIRQGKEMGVYMYIYTGGEPLVRKADLITLCERHSDCIFLSFTNATLIDEQFVSDMLRVKNFIPAISVEGFETATDGRRGEGDVYKRQRSG